MSAPAQPKQIETSSPNADQIIYTLQYRRGDNPHPMQKNFRASSELKIPQLVERCKTYCTNMNYRFISVGPWLSDLAMDEQKQQQLG
jgi:hypothetical protein